MPIIRIRKGTVKDIRSIEQLLRTICLEFGWRYEVDFDPSDANPASYNSNGGKMFVAIREGHIVGCIAFRQRNEIAMLLRFYVHPAFRQIGIGTQLLITLIKELGTRGVSTVFFGTEKENLPYILPAARRFGFHRTVEPPTTFSGEECSFYFARELRRDVRRVA